MFRVLFFILICTLLFYSFSSIYNPVKELSNKQISQKYEDYLSGALARNTLPENLYDVVFYREDFVDSVNNGDYFRSTPSLESKTTSENLSFWETWESSQVSVWSEDIDQTDWFTSEGFTQALGGASGECTWGLIFDPCIVPGDPNGKRAAQFFGMDKYSS